jgi:hypothetical protein
MRVFLRRKHRAYVALRKWYRWLSTQPFTKWPDSQERYSARVGRFGLDRWCSRVTSPRWDFQVVEDER